MKIRAINPFRKFRTEQGLSQTEFGKLCGVSKHAILRLEQGMYDKPLPSVVEYVYANSGLDRGYLLDEYVRYQAAVRKQEPRVLGHNIVQVLSEGPDSIHPLRHLRMQVGINQTELAKKLCISQSVVNNFENKWVNQHSVPRQLLDALSQNGYTNVDLGALDACYRQWRKLSLEFQQVRLVG